MGPWRHGFRPWISLKANASYGLRRLVPGRPRWSFKAPRSSRWWPNAETQNRVGMIKGRAPYFADRVEGESTGEQGHITICIQCKDARQRRDRMDAQTIEIRKSTPHIGAEVLGVDLS